MDRDRQKIHELEEKFVKEMNGITAPIIGLAVSGGGDSLALLFMASRWVKSSQRILKVVTVDHNLRHESKEEANAVGSIADTLGHHHDILEWK